jgi:hypothetical protein
VSSSTIPSSLSNTDKTREENLTVLHAVSLALVKQLGCENDADLPTTFTAPPELDNGLTAGDDKPASP